MSAPVQVKEKELPLQHGKKASPSIIESLASIILPEGILDLFEVTHVEEEHTGNMDETGTEVRVIHIYLDERQKEWHDLQPKGFTESRKINDFSDSRPQGRPSYTVSQMA